ncbi:hypothetical protein [Weissella viridescens]|uniref:hypothetical protein n=1 Tax=Weissella viridescens TaxID=1629 RepID=UPI003AF2B44A
MRQTIFKFLGYIGSFCILMTLITTLFGFISWASNYVNGFDLVTAFVITILIMKSGNFKISFGISEDA